MKDFKEYFAFLVIALGLSASCFAAQTASQTFDNYYIQPAGVYVTPGGIFVWVDGQLAQVGMLCSDDRGVFVPYEEMNRRFVRCPHCDGWYDPEHPENHKCKGR